MEINLPVGVQSFEQLRSNGSFYVDKTPFIKTVMKNGADVLLITRPRRFGKSLFMDTMKTFLRMNLANPGDITETAKLFSGLKILNDQAFCQEFMGRFPVISLTLSNIDGKRFEQACERLASTLLDVATEFAFLADSPALLAWEKALMQNYLTPSYLKDPTHLCDMQDFLKNLVAWLSRHCGQSVVLLIDEYDVPLAKAAKNGYFADMLELIQSFFGQAMKPRANSNAKPYLRKAVVTGCLRVSKESLFTDFNNPEVNTVFSTDATLAEAIGFSSSDVMSILDCCGLTSRFDVVKAWYDGYRFADREIYCPWDVVNFCQQAGKSPAPEAYEPSNFWSSTSENAEIYEFLGFLSGEDTEKMQALLDGKTIEITVNEKLSYRDLARHRPQDFWTLLATTGYLTVVEPPRGASNACRVRIPNQEIRETFEEKILQYFSAADARFAEHSIAFAKAALSGNVDNMTEALESALDGFVSLRDAATKAPTENYYHGFLNAMFSNALPLVKNYQSNGEAGDGYADIAFTSGLGSKSVGVVIEIKCRKQSDEVFTAADEAAEQIVRKHYTRFFDKFRCGKRFAYGIGFAGKNCAVVSPSDPSN